MALTIQQKLDIASACSIYASNELGNGKVHGGLLDERLPSLLFAYGQGVQWLYDLDPTNADLDTLSNYLISLCKHQARAENEIVGGGGSIPSVSSNVSGNYYVIQTGVTGTAGQPVAGESTFQDDRMIGATQLAFIFLNNAVLSILMGDITFDSSSGTITLQNSNVWQGSDRIDIPFVRA